MAAGIVASVMAAPAAPSAPACPCSIIRQKPSRSPALSDIDHPTPPARRLRRTTFVSDEQWRIFPEFKAGIVGRKGEARVAVELERLGLPMLHDITLADEHGPTQVDHLVLSVGGIVVIETKTYAGAVEGEPDGRTWTQMVGGESHVRPNALYQNHRHCLVVQQILDVAGCRVPVTGCVVAAGSASFCEALAGLVVGLNALPAMVGSPPADGMTQDRLSVAWMHVVEAATLGEERRDEHAEMVRRRTPDSPAS